MLSIRLAWVASPLLRGVYLYFCLRVYLVQELSC